MDAVSDKRLGMLCDIGELHAVLSASDNIETFLQQIVEMVAKHVDAGVCTIYLFNETQSELRLVASHGLNAALDDHIILKKGEGLVGLALEESRPVCEPDASRHPRYKLIPGIDEEQYDAFLAVPIVRGIQQIGVLVVQRSQDNPFDPNDVMAMRAIASQLAGAIENARLLMALHGEHAQPVTDEPAPITVIHGKVASEGFAVGPSAVLDRQSWRRMFSQHLSDKKYSLADFKAAAAKTERQLERLQAKVEEHLSDVASLIFEAQILMLKDPEFTGAMVKQIEAGANPPFALQSVAGMYIDILSNSNHAYTREKAKDVEDLVVRLFGNLIERDTKVAMDWERRIVIARELYPSDILKLFSARVGGVILVSGGVTSHVSILASSLQLPMIIVDETRLLKLPEQSEILLDAELGNIYCEPSKDLVRRYCANRELMAKQLKREPPTPTTFTHDGTQIHLMANINLLNDVQLAREMNAEGIGLYRTEFPFMVRSNFPSEEEQIVVYRRLIELNSSKLVTIRTLDIGGDKALAYYDMATEENPTMGMRSIRFSLEHTEIFHQQIRAILRATAGAERVRIMFPMISSVDEFQQSKAAVEDCIRQLQQHEFEHHDKPEIGLMIEIPSVVPIIDTLAREADFLCIGTNDFIQFMLAVDRTNAKVASYFLPHHPSILRALKQIADAATAADTDISVCGEMAHETDYVPFLIGIGVRSLSIDPRYLPRVQTLISGMDIDQARRDADAILHESTIRGVEAHLARQRKDRAD